MPSLVAAASETGTTFAIGGQNLATVASDGTRLLDAKSDRTGGVLGIGGDATDNLYVLWELGALDIYSTKERVRSVGVVASQMAVSSAGEVAFVTGGMAVPHLELRNVDLTVRWDVTLEARPTSIVLTDAYAVVLDATKLTRIDLQTGALVGQAAVQLPAWAVTSLTAKHLALVWPMGPEPDAYAINVLNHEGQLIWQSARAIDFAGTRQVSYLNGYRAGPFVRGVAVDDASVTFALTNNGDVSVLRVDPEGGVLAEQEITGCTGFRFPSGRNALVRAGPAGYVLASDYDVAGYSW